MQDQDKDIIIKDQIQDLITILQDDQMIHIPFYTIAGSRGMGVEHDGSDYDVRFIYMETFERRNLAIGRKQVDPDGTVKVTLDNRAQTIDRNTIGRLVPEGFDVSGLSLRKLLNSAREGSSETYFLLNSQKNLHMSLYFNQTFNLVKDEVFHYGKAARSLIKAAKSFSEKIMQASVIRICPRTTKDSLRTLTYLRSALDCMGRCYPDTERNHRHLFLLATVQAHVDSLKLADTYRPADLAYGQIIQKHGNWSLLKRLIEEFYEIYTPEAIMNRAEHENVSDGRLNEISQHAYRSFMNFKVTMG